jgi:hypothetical protein
MLTNLLTEADTFDNVSIIDDEYTVLRNGRNEVVVGISAGDRRPQKCRGQGRSQDAGTSLHAVGRLSMTKRRVSSDFVVTCASADKSARIILRL